MARDASNLDIHNHNSTLNLNSPNIKLYLQKFLNSVQTSKPPIPIIAILDVLFKDLLQCLSLVVATSTTYLNPTYKPHTSTNME